jgi:hypothetical protein
MSMDPAAWLANFQSLHEQMKAGRLTDEQTKKYVSMREELAASVTASQKTTVPKGEKSHRYLKVQQMMPVEINNLYNAMTREVWAKGFVAIVPSNIPKGSSVEFSLKIKRDQGVAGKGLVTLCTKQPGNYRIEVDIDAMAEASVTMLEDACLEAFLARMPK